VSGDSMLLLNGWVLIVFVVICYAASRFLARFVNKDKRPVMWMREVLKFLFVLYLSMVVAVTLFPIIIGHTPNVQNEYRSFNFIPLVTIYKYFSQIGTAYDGDVGFMIELIAKNIGGNILLLMPLGFCAPILFNQFNSFKNVVLLGLLMSICIECIQFLELRSGIVLWRSVDIDDVICNVIGAVFGYLIYSLLSRFENMKSGKFKM
jgi:glycopeptide antibiotics resistance protein